MATGLTPDAPLPFVRKGSPEVAGDRMADIDEGQGNPIVFAPGNPASSCPWRNIMAARRGLRRRSRQSIVRGAGSGWETGAQ